MRRFDDFTLPGFWRDPIPVFQASFAIGQRIQASPDGGLAILGYHALSEVGLHPAIDGTPMAPPGAGEPRGVYEVLRKGLFAQIAPDHRWSRRAVLAGLNRRAIEDFAPRARVLAQERLDALGARPFDLFRGLCLPFAAAAWAAFLGYDPEEAEQLAEEVEIFSAQLVFNANPSTAGAADAAATSLLSRTRRAVAAGGARPAATMAKALGGRCGAALVASLLFDAVDTAAAGLAGTLAILLDAAVDAEALRDATFREQAIEEALRLATPAVFTVRQAREAVEIDGMSIPQGATVWMWWSAGNCDPEAFPEPACFRPGRANRGLPFGIGAHSCVGHGWTKQLAHILIAAGLAGDRRLAKVSPRSELDDRRGAAPARSVGHPAVTGW